MVVVAVAGTDPAESKESVDGNVGMLGVSVLFRPVVLVPCPKEDRRFKAAAAAAALEAAVDFSEMVEA